MRTLLISGDAPPPRPLRDVIARGSTALEERRAGEVSSDVAATPDIDRIVFWATAGDAVVTNLARDCAGVERASGRETIVFVTPQGTEAKVDGLLPNEVFVWPRDEDRLKMAFMTGG